MELDPRFKIRAPLRCEGIGRLDCAEDLESGMRMAVRWLPLEANGSAAVHACEQLPEHPTLPRIRQIGQMGASAYIAMDFPDGNLLATQLHEVQPAARLIGIATQIADALASIHSQGVFHGEMSADSVLLVSAPSEKAYLWDMPLVIANRLTDRRGEDRLMYQLVKSAAYLAPERARGGIATAQSDVYALGAIICIAGGAPLPIGETTLAIIYSVAEGGWVPKVPSSLSDPLRSMLERMVAREPSTRPTAREVAEFFMAPPVAHRTEPEMPAVVLPASTPVSRAPVADSSPTEPMPTMPRMSDTLDLRDPAAKAFSQPLVIDVKPTVGVQLTESISVSQELANDGAALLYGDEASQVGRRNRRVPLMVAAVMAMLVLVLGGLAISLSRQAVLDSDPAPAALRVPPVNGDPAARVVGSAIADSAGVDEATEDELSALTRRKKVASKKRPAKAGMTQKPAEAPPKEGGGRFLEQESELKRPTF